MVEGGGFEPPKAEPSDLQSDPFGHSGTPPKEKTQITLGLILGAWRCPTLTWELPHYHRRNCVSLLSSAWIQVVPQCYCRQA